MTQPQRDKTAVSQKEDEEDDTKVSSAVAEAVIQPTKPLQQEDDEEQNDDNAESSSTSSSGGQGSGEGYTADCSSDASSDLSGSAKKKEKDNMILSVNNLSLNGEEEGDDENDNAPKDGEAQEDAPAAGRQQQHASSNNAQDSDNKKLKRGKKKKKHGGSLAAALARGRQESSDGDSDMADVEDEGTLPAQFNGVQVVHPMDPRIDISNVGYLHASPVARGLGDQSSKGGDQLSNHDGNQEEAPSLENYLQLMEVVRPFFNSHGIGSKDQEPNNAGGMPIGDPNVAHHNRAHHAAASRRPRTAYGPSAGDSRTSTSLTGTRSSSSQSTGSAGGRRRDAPLHFPPAQAAHAAKAPQVPLQLAARQKPLAAAAAADFYAPDDDPADEDDSDTSSMVVLARTKKKHKQHSAGASESASQESRSLTSDGGLGANAAHAAQNAGADQDDAENDEDDRKPAARPQAPLQEANQPAEHPPAAEDEAAQGNASSSSSGGDNQRLQAVANQPGHNYEAHVVTESASNTNTTTSGSGSGSGGNSGSNQGSSGSGNGSSGSGNGSSGSGNEGKGSSEDKGTNEENSGEGNSNSEDINSDDRQPPNHEKEIAHPMAARRHGAGAAADGGVNDPMKLDPDAPSAQALSDQHDAARERKLQDKKRKRMNMRREYEEKVQQEMESSESSATHNAITLRPGRPVTLDKVLSFTKIARMVIQAGPPFLVVHTNAAYTRLTGIDAHAAVGKPVSALLSVQGPERLSSSMNPDEGTRAENVARAAASAADQEASAARQLMGPPPPNRMGAFEVATINANSINGQRLGQSHAEAEEAGRARAAQASQNDSGNINLERLVAACGFGKYHVLHARARPHQMVGRNVTFVNKSGVAPGLPPTGPGMNGMRKQDDGSSDTSLTSNFEGPFDCLKCRSSISPIISDTIDSAVVTDYNQEPHTHKNKRRKHHHHVAEQPVAAAASRSGHFRRSFPGKDSAVPKRYQQYVTHYAIQLEVFDDSKDLNDHGGSSSSTSVEANLLGLTKAELRRQRQAAQAGEHGTSQEDSEQRHPQEDDDEMASETTEGTVPVTAVG